MADPEVIPFWSYFRFEGENDRNPEFTLEQFDECFGDFKTNAGQIGEASVRAPSVGIRSEWSGKSETVESEDRDVVGLAETLRLFGDAMRCLGADFTSTFETEKLAVALWASTTPSESSVR